MSRRLADDPLSAVDPHAVPPVTRRAELEAAAAINVLAGCWLVAAPFVLDDTAGDPLLVDRLVGLVVAAVGLARLGGRLRASRLAWAPATLGGGLIITALLLADSDTARFNETAIGAIVLLAGTVGAAVSGVQRRSLRS